MKRSVIIATVLLILFFSVLIITAEIISFATVKPTARSINDSLANYFSKIVRIPKGIPPPSYDFDQTTYFWEMETLEKEVIGVRFKHQTGFSKNQDAIEVTLEMPQNGDPSIFGKVLPAIIADSQSLNSAQDPKKANLSENQQIGYKSIELELKESTGQTTKITWIIPKSNLTEDLKSLYNKFYNYPEPILRFLYALSEFTLGLFRG